MKSPMLAASTDGTSLKLPMLASPKLDGVRALVIDGCVLSRNFKPIPNRHVQFLFGREELNGLDGELIAGDASDPDCFRNTSSAVMSEAGKPDVKFHVFDDFTRPEWSFSGRLESVFRRTAGHQHVQYVTHITVRTQDQLERYEEAMLARGYEGVMLRHPSGIYKEGRSTLKEGLLLKLKRFEDGEAEVLGHYELMHNANEKTITTGAKAERSHKKSGMVGMNLLGGLHVHDLKSGAHFDVGSGFTQADREIYWAMREDLVGRIIKYQHFPIGAKDKPRFPTFKGFRDPIDL